MKRKILKNKPLVEAIFELRWKLERHKSGLQIDPHYKLLIGRLYDRLQNEYPYHEQLGSGAIPDELAGYVIQHRFRKDRNEWPLVQIGPGIITLNETEGYVWEEFASGITQAVNALYDAYPNSGTGFTMERLMLRYIDSITFDFEKQDIFSFLKQQMKMNVELHSNLFEGTGIDNLPLGFDLSFSFASANPEGRINIRFTRGTKNGRDALVWETMVDTGVADIPQDKQTINDWIAKAHDLTDDWFFKIIDGDLLRRFE